MSSLYFHELVGQVEEQLKQSLTVDDFLNKVFDTINKIICIEEFDDSKILVDTDDEISDDITLKKAVALISCILNDDDKFYQQMFLEEALIV